MGFWKKITKPFRRIRRSMKKRRGLSAILGIAAAVAMPYVAPAVASTLGVTQIAASAGLSAGWTGALASGLTGAALGAGTQYLTGGDPTVGAAIGGISGGYGGYSAATAPAQAAQAVASQPVTIAGASGPNVLGAGGAGQIVTVGTQGINPSADGGFFSGGLSGLGSKVTTGLGNVVSDPVKMAQITMAANSLLSEPDNEDIYQGMTPEERALTEQRKRELEQIAKQNQQLYQMKVREAQSYLQSAKQHAGNPQRAFIDAKLSAERQAADAGRGMSPARAAAARRAARIRTTEAASTAASNEASRGRDASLSYQRAGLSAIPTGAPERAAGLQGPMYDALRERSRKRRKEDNQLMGSLTSNLFG